MSADKMNELPPASSDDSSIAKKKRTRLSLTEKIEAAELLKNGTKSVEVMRKYNISRRTISSIRTNIDDLVRKATQASLPSDRKTFREARYPELDQLLKQYISIARAGKMRINADLLRERALTEKERLISKNPESPLHSFTASKGWTDSFLRRNSLQTPGERGEPGDINLITLAADIAKMRDQLRTYGPECIYNLGETSLFYRLLPRRSYTNMQGNMKSVQGTKYMKTEDRITTYVCTNADGSVKVPISMIGLEKHPPCFRLGSPSVPYLSQEHAWSDGVTFKVWFEEIFLPCVRTNTTDPVILLVDLSITNGFEPQDIQGQVRIAHFPRNSATIHQPVERGIITAWKALYKHCLLKDVAQEVETRNNRRLHAENLLPELRGLTEGYEPNLLEVSELIHTTWNELSLPNIINCWLRADILPRPMQAVLQSGPANIGIARFIPDNHMLSDMMKIMTSLRASLQEQDPFFSSVSDEITSEDAEKWIDIEEDQGTIEAVVNDVFEGMQGRNIPEVVLPATAVAAPPTIDAEMSVENGEKGPPVSRELPTRVELLQMFADLENLAYECNVPLASNHLRKARNALVAASRKET